MVDCATARACTVCASTNLRHTVITELAEMGGPARRERGLHLAIGCVTSPVCRLDGRMFRVPLGRLLVRVTHAAQHRFAQPPTNELHVSGRPSIERPHGTDRVGLPLKLNG